MAAVDRDSDHYGKDAENTLGYVDNKLKRLGKRNFYRLPRRFIRSMKALSHSVSIVQLFQLFLILLQRQGSFGIFHLRAGFIAIVLDALLV